MIYCKHTVEKNIFNSLIWKHCFKDMAGWSLKLDIFSSYGLEKGLLTVKGSQNLTYVSYKKILSLLQFS